MWSRRQFQQIVLGSAAALALPATAVRAAPEKPRIKVAVYTRDSFNQLPLVVAQQLGYFKAEGLDVELIDSVNITSQAPDVWSSAYTRVLSQHAQRVANPSQVVHRSFAVLGRGPLVALGLGAAELANEAAVGNANIKDLRGKRVAVVRAGVLTSVLAQYVLSRAGLGPQDVSLVPLDSPSDALGALRSGQVQAVSNCDPVMSLLEMRGEIKVMSDARTLRGAQQVFGGPMPAVCLNAPSAFLAANPQTCQALTNGLVRAAKWLLVAGPSDIVKTVPESDMMGDRALYLSSFERARESFSSDAVMSTEGCATALKVLAQYDANVKAARLVLDTTYTNEFATKAKARFRA
jgi:NitT/TauT family transport system substrate-binding protein